MAAATVYPCRGATITVGTDALAGIVDATITLTHEPIESTEISDTGRQYATGIVSSTVSGTIYYNQGNAAISAMETKCANGSSTGLTIVLHTGAQYAWTTSFLTSFAPGLAVNDVVRASFSFQCVGAPTIT